MAKDLKSVLREFLKVNGVVAAAIVGRDGFVIEHVASGNVDVDALGAMVATAIGTSESLGNEFSLGGLDQYLVEFTEGKVVMAAAGEDILSLITDNSAVIGGVRYAIRKGIGGVRDAL